jgi:hypothetical protein
MKTKGELVDLALEAALWALAAFFAAVILLGLLHLAGVL